MGKSKKRDSQDTEEWYGKDRKISPTGRGGKSKTVTLPQGFLAKLKGNSVHPYQVGDILVLVPPEPTEPKIGELDFQDNDPDFLEYHIISAYLNNYRRIDVAFKENKECTDCIERLPKKLLGLSPSFGGDMNRREIHMSTLVEPIPNLLNKMSSSVNTIHRFNQNILSTFKAPTQVEQVNIEALENDIDKQSFLIKRLFFIVLTRLHLAYQAGIEEFNPDYPLRKRQFEP